MKAVRQDK